MSDTQKLIAVVGATGQQGGAVVRALQASGQFKVRALTLNRRGHKFSYKQVPQELFAGWFPGAKEIAEMLAYFEAHTYLGADSRDAITLANRVAGRQPAKFAAWARENFAITAAA